MKKANWPKQTSKMLKKEKTSFSQTLFFFNAQHLCAPSSIATNLVSPINSTNTGLRLSLISSALITLSTIGSNAALAQTLPQGAAVVSGQANISTSISTNGAHMSVTNSNNAIINWNSFSIGQGSSVNFQQPSASSSVLNRVVTPNPSTIAGSLTSNGKVILINPSGIAFSQGASIDTAGFTASTVNIKNNDFLSGRLSFAPDPSDSIVSLRSGSGINTQGTIALKGNVVFVAKDITTTGQLSSNGSSIVMAAGSEVEVFDLHTPQIRVVVKNTTSDNKIVIDNASVKTTGGSISLLADSLVLKSSKINANSIAVDPLSSKITLVANKVDIAKSDLVANQIKINKENSNIKIDSSSISAVSSKEDTSLQESSQILIGLESKDDKFKQNAKSVAISNSSLSAVSEQNKENSIYIMSRDTSDIDNTTLVSHSPLTPGFIETSSQNHLSLQESVSVNTTSGSGARGTWLLDPLDIEIVASVNSNSNLLAGQVTPTASPSQVSAATILSAMNSSNVIIDTTASTGAQTGKITVSAPIIKNSPSAFGSLQLKAAGDIEINSPIGLSTGYSGSNFQINLDTPANVIFDLTGKIFNDSLSKINLDINAGSSLQFNSPTYPSAISTGTVLADAGVVNINAVNGITTSASAVVGPKIKANTINLSSSAGSIGSVSTALLTQSQNLSFNAPVGVVHIENSTTNTGPLNVTLSSASINAKNNSQSELILKETSGALNINAALGSATSSITLQSNLAQAINAPLNASQSVNLSSNNAGITIGSNIQAKDISAATTAANSDIIVSSHLTAVDSINLNATQLTTLSGSSKLETTSQLASSTGVHLNGNVIMQPSSQIISGSTFRVDSNNNPFQSLSGSSIQADKIIFASGPVDIAGNLTATTSMLMHSSLGSLLLAPTSTINAPDFEIKSNNIQGLNAGITSTNMSVQSFTPGAISISDSRSASPSHLTLTPSDLNHTGVGNLTIGSLSTQELSVDAASLSTPSRLKLNTSTSGSSAVTLSSTSISSATAIDIQTGGTINSTSSTLESNQISLKGNDITIPTVNRKDTTSTSNLLVEALTATLPSTSAINIDNALVKVNDLSLYSSVNTTQSANFTNNTTDRTNSFKLLTGSSINSKNVSIEAQTGQINSTLNAENLTLSANDLALDSAITFKDVANIRSKNITSFTGSVFSNGLNTNAFITLANPASEANQQIEIAAAPEAQSALAFKIDPTWLDSARFNAPNFHIGETVDTNSIKILTGFSSNLPSLSLTTNTAAASLVDINASSAVSAQSMKINSSIVSIGSGLSTSSSFSSSSNSLSALSNLSSPTIKLWARDSMTLGSVHNATSSYDIASFGLIESNASYSATAGSYKISSTSPGGTTQRMLITSPSSAVASTTVLNSDLIARISSPIITLDSGAQNMDFDTASITTSSGIMTKSSALQITNSNLSLGSLSADASSFLASSSSLATNVSNLSITSSGNQTIENSTLTSTAATANITLNSTAGNILLNSSASNTSVDSANNITFNANSGTITISSATASSWISVKEDVSLNPIGAVFLNSLSCTGCVVLTQKPTAAAPQSGIFANLSISNTTPSPAPAPAPTTPPAPVPPVPPPTPAVPPAPTPTTPPAPAPVVEPQLPISPVNPTPNNPGIVNPTSLTPQEQVKIIEVVLKELSSGQIDLQQAIELRKDLIDKKKKKDETKSANESTLICE